MRHACGVCGSEKSHECDVDVDVDGCEWIKWDVDAVLMAYEENDPPMCL